MAAPSYENPLYAAYLTRHNIYDDTLPTPNPAVLKEWQDYSGDLARYSKDKDAQGLKERIEDKKLRLGYIKASQDFLAKIEETKGKNARVSLQEFVDRNNNLTDNSTKIATQGTQYTSRAFEPSKEAFRTAPGNTGAAASLAALTRAMTDKGISYDASKPEIAGLATQWATMVLKAPDIMSVTEDQAAKAVQDAGGGDTLQQQARELIRAGKQSESAVRSANMKIKDSADYAKQLSAAGGQVTQEQMDELGKKMAEAELGFRYLVGRSPEELSSDIESLKSYDSQYQFMLEREKQLRDVAFGVGKEGLRSKMGRIMADPDFQLWARDNGYELGQAQIDENGNVLYVPGPQDERALLRFAYQARTGRQSPWPFAGKPQPTGELVKVTITNEGERQRLLSGSDLGGGKYAISADGSLVDPAAYREEMKKLGFTDPQVEVAFDDNGNHYFKADGQYYVVGADSSVGSLSEAPTGVTFKPAVFYGNGDTAQHYLTLDELKGGKAQLFDADGNPRYGVYEQADQEAFDKASPYKVVGADQIQGLGVQTFEGYRDKRNASTLGAMGNGAFSINGGQYVFGEGAKYEVLLSDAEKTPGARRQARLAEKAQRELGGATGMPTEQVLRTEAPRPAARPAAQPPLTALGEQAVTSPAAAARTEQLQRQDLLVTGGTAATGGAAAPTPAAAPAAEDVTYVKTKDGATYKANVDGVQMVAPPTGGTLDTKVVPYANLGDLEAKLKEGEKVAAPAGIAPPAAAPTPAAGPTMVTAPPVGRPRPEVTREGEVTRIDYGARRPSFGEKVATGLERAAGAVSSTVGGLFRRKPGEEGLEAGPSAAEPTLVEKIRTSREAARGDRARAEAEAARPALPPLAPLPDSARNAPLETGLPSIDEARKRGLDEQIMGFLLDKNVDPKVSDLAGRAQVLTARRAEADKARDLARRGLGQMPEFDADAYTAQVRALADEARERMRGRRGTDLSLFDSTPGKVEGLGSNIEGETPVLQLPGTETNIAVSPFLRRAVESLGRRRAPAQPEAAAPPSSQILPPASTKLVTEEQKTGPSFLRKTPPAAPPATKKPPVGATKPAPAKPADDELNFDTSIEMASEQPNQPQTVPMGRDLGAGSFTTFGVQPFSKQEATPLTTFQRLRQQALRAKQGNAPTNGGVR